MLLCPYEGEGGKLAFCAATKYSAAGRPSTGKLRGGALLASTRPALAMAEIDIPFHADTTCGVGNEHVVAS